MVSGPRIAYGLIAAVVAGIGFDRTLRFLYSDGYSAEAAELLGTVPVVLLMLVLPIIAHIDHGFDLGHHDAGAPGGHGPQTGVTTAGHGYDPTGNPPSSYPSPATDPGLPTDVAAFGAGAFAGSHFTAPPPLHTADAGGAHPVSADTGPAAPPTATVGHVQAPGQPIEEPAP